MSEHLTIKPAPGLLTQGTKVFLGDKEVDGVISIELYAAANDVWRAKLVVLVEIGGEITAEPISAVKGVTA